MIRREQARLKRVIQKVLLMSLASVPAGAYACSSSNDGGGGFGQDGGTHDATAGDAANGGDAQPGLDSGGGGMDAGMDGYTANCTPSAPFIDDASVGVNDAGMVVTDEAGTPITCYVFKDFPCGPNLQGIGDAATNGHCYIGLGDCARAFPSDDGGGPCTDCHFWEGYGCTNGNTTWQPGQMGRLACGKCSGVGRRPEGLCEPTFERAATPVGDWFAQAAHLEAASVDAFRVLEMELARLGAPKELVAMAARSAKDEVRHARTTSRLARRGGGHPVAPRVRRRPPRALAKIARENAVEGCVRETFGAMLASWQAAHAKDAEIARAMRTIAADETRHAALAWAIARWADEKLDAKTRARIAKARAAAIRTLRGDMDADVDEALVRDAGLPPRAQALAMIDALETALWS